mmetsp:Transcript_3718/g.11958  ORF Transcript_3718/g.11958 Transcript_3718/m.11958 type:complete len:226 (+) Transcript_3718:379-1056(+)
MVQPRSSCHVCRLCGNILDFRFAEHTNIKPQSVYDQRQISTRSKLLLFVRGRRRRSGAADAEVGRARVLGVLRARGDAVAEAVRGVAEEGAALLDAVGHRTLRPGRPARPTRVLEHLLAAPVARRPVVVRPLPHVANHVVQACGLTRRGARGARGGQISAHLGSSRLISSSYRPVSAPPCSFCGSSESTGEVKGHPSSALFLVGKMPCQMFARWPAAGSSSSPQG